MVKLARFAIFVVVFRCSLLRKMAKMTRKVMTLVKLAGFAIFVVV